MAFGNFWRGGGRERFGSERDQDRNRDRWRTTGSDWRDDERDRWRESEQQRSGAWERDRDEYGSREGGGREGRYGSADWESGDYYGDRSRGSSGQGSSGGYGGRGYGSEGYGRSGYGSGGSEYDYRGGSLYGGGFGRGSGGSYGTAGSYGEDYRSGSRSQAQGMQGQGMHRGRGPRNYKRSDERIREDVCECLTQDDWIDASSIEVTVQEGEVTLTGSVFERQDKRRAEDLVEGISGVKDVRNNLRTTGEQSGQQPTSSQGQQGSEGQQSQSGQSSRH